MRKILFIISIYTVLLTGTISKIYTAPGNIAGTVQFNIPDVAVKVSNQNFIAGIGLMSCATGFGLIYTALKDYRDLCQEKNTPTNTSYTVLGSIGTSLIVAGTIITLSSGSINNLLS